MIDEKKEIQQLRLELQEKNAVIKMLSQALTTTQAEVAQARDRGKLAEKNEAITKLSISLFKTQEELNAAKQEIKKLQPKKRVVKKSRRR